MVGAGIRGIKVGWPDEFGASLKGRKSAEVAKHGWRTCRFRKLPVLGDRDVTSCVYGYKILGRTVE